jgi:hypothetical protein
VDPRELLARERGVADLGCGARDEVDDPRRKPGRLEQLDDLTDASCLVETTRERGIIAPAFALYGVEIWGATAMVLAEFLTLVGWSRS